MGFVHAHTSHNALTVCLKVMFISAFARPRFDHHTHTWWDGKIGTWPIGDWEPATRGSANRPAGTMEWKDKSVTKELYRHYLLCKVIPAIVDKWPRGQWNNPNFKVRIQQDGAPSHIRVDDNPFNLQLQHMHLHNKIELYVQPPNSPDLNVLDLGPFRALQSMHFKKTSADVPDVINNVILTYNEYDYKKINYVFLTLMAVMNEVIECEGDNSYKLPHLGKQSLEKRHGQVPLVLDASESALPHLAGHATL